MSSPSPTLPICRPLESGFSLIDAFEKLAGCPGCLWLDSASRGGDGKPGLSRALPRGSIGRFSFLTADPVDTLVASAGASDPWPQLDAWCRKLPTDADPSLPPFQGGVAGLIGYEAATWLEPIPLAPENDLPTAAISLGLYDWTIATDHQTERSWIISQGLGAADPNERYRVAVERADAVEAFLSGDTGRLPSRDRCAERRCDPDIASAQHETSIDNLRSSFSSEGFRQCVAEIVQLICKGDSFQVNLAQRLLKRSDLSSPELYCRLRRTNPAPFGAYYGGTDFEVLSSSPEGFLRVRSGLVQTRPIKGTIHRTGNEREDDRLADQLVRSEKDRAENVMIVDLMRNDLSRVCSDDSVTVQQLCEIERYEFVQHLVSVVEGRLAAGKTVADLLRACFPGGSVTGAPKIEAMRTIARLEPNPRGPYCGSIGYISCGGDADFNILIRTITAAGGYWQIPVGGGITARSDPAAEEAETWAKAEGMLRAIAED
jgi:para-aminobenzoate synthetase component 1